MSRKAEQRERHGIPEISGSSKQQKAARWVQDNYFKGRVPIPNRNLIRHDTADTGQEVIVPPQFWERNFLARIGNWTASPTELVFPKSESIFAGPRAQLFSGDMAERFYHNAGRQKAYKGILKLMQRAPIPYVAAETIPNANHCLTAVFFTLRPNEATASLMQEDAEEVQRVLNLRSLPRVPSPIIAKLAGRVDSPHVVGFQYSMDNFLAGAPAGEAQITLSQPQLL